MIRLGLAQLRCRPARYIGLLLAVVALTFAAAAIGLTIRQTVDRTFAAPYASAGYVQTVEGVVPEMPPGAVFDRRTSAPVSVEGNLYQSTPITGVSEGPLQWHGVLEGRLPHGPGEIAATGEEPAVGSVQTLLFGAQQVEVTVVGRVTPSAGELLVGGARLVADNEAIVQWQPTDTPSGEVRSAAAFLSSMSAAAHVQTHSDDYFASRNKYFLLLTVFTVVVAIVAALTIYSAMSVITGSRVRETKLVRAIGGSSIGILATVVEATVLGLLGVALGLRLEVALAGAAPVVTEELGIRVPLDNVGLPASWLAAIGAVALAVTVLSALPAAVLSVRRSAVESAEALRSRALQAGYVVVAVVFAGAAFALRGGGVIRAVASAGLATLSAAAALSVIIPLLLRVRVPLPRLGLALGYASRQWNRSASVIGIVTVAVALVAAVLTGSEHLRSHFVDAAGKEGLVDATVTSLTGDIDSTLADVLAATPGVAASLVPPRVPEGFAVDPGSPVLRRGVQSGVVSLAQGSTLDTELPTVKTSNLFTVVDLALVADADAVDAAPRPTVMLRMEGAPVQDPAVLDGVRAAAAGADVPVTMTESFSRRTDTVAMVERLLSITRMMSLVALVIALVGIANTVFLSWRERRQDRALLNTLGLTPLGSAGVVAVELLLLALPAAGAGWLVGEWAGGFIAAVAVG